MKSISLAVILIVTSLAACDSVDVGKKDDRSGKKTQSLALLSSPLVATCSSGRMDQPTAAALQKLYRLTDTNPSSEGCGVLASRAVKLKTLDLSGLGLTDIGFLAEFTALTSLDLHNNKLTDIKILKQMSELTTLDISDNKVSDLTPLSNLKKLSKLTDANNPATNPPAKK